MDSTDLRVFLAIILAGCVLQGVAENCTTHPLHKAQNPMPAPSHPAYTFWPVPRQPKHTTVFSPPRWFSNFPNVKTKQTINKSKNKTQNLSVTEF